VTDDVVVREVRFDDALVREVRLDDAEALVAILNPIIAARAYTVLDEPFSVAAEADYIRGFPARGVFVVAETCGGVVAMQSIEPFADYTAALRHVGVIGTFVALQARRRGLGSLLCAASASLARAKGFRKLLTYVRADNPAALAFYAEQGFRVVGTAVAQARIDGVFLDEVIIERQL
jgi:L-amino acid N-acyltransferase YncA